MSQEYEELARRAYAALNRQDLAAFLRLIDPDVEFVSGAGHFEGGAYHGHSGVRDWWADLHGVYSDWTVEALSFRHLGANRFVTKARGRGHGTRSGAPVEVIFWQASQMRDGKVHWWRTCLNEAEAIEALELSG